MSARNYFSKFEVSEVPRHIAMGARISLLENDSQTAETLLRRAVSIADQKGGADNKYVGEYCRYFLSIINRDGKHEIYRNRAIELSVSSVVKDSLPLPSNDVLSEF